MVQGSDLAENSGHWNRNFAGVSGLVDSYAALGLNMVHLFARKQSGYGYSNCMYCTWSDLKWRSQQTIIREYFFNVNLWKPKKFSFFAGNFSFSLVQYRGAGHLCEKLSTFSQFYFNSSLLLKFEQWLVRNFSPYMFHSVLWTFFNKFLECVHFLKYPYWGCLLIYLFL